MNHDNPTIMVNTKLVKECMKKDGVKVITKTSNTTGFNSLISGKKITDIDELPKQDLVGHDIGLKIEQARLGKKLKQTEVANMLNMPLPLYQSHERGTAIKNGKNLNQIGIKLGIKLTGKNL